MFETSEIETHINVRHFILFYWEQQMQMNLQGGYLILACRLLFQIDHNLLETQEAECLEVMERPEEPKIIKCCSNDSRLHWGTFH